MSKDTRVADAIDMVAHNIAGLLLTSAAELESVEWEDYPEIGEYDFVAVMERVESIAKAMRPTTAQFSAAYDFLAERADHDA